MENSLLACRTRRWASGQDAVPRQISPSGWRRSPHSTPNIRRPTNRHELKADQTLMSDMHGRELAAARGDAQHSAEALSRGSEGEGVWPLGLAAWQPKGAPHENPRRPPSLSFADKRPPAETLETSGGSEDHDHIGGGATSPQTQR